MGEFIFDSYVFDHTTGRASFRYAFAGGYSFEEVIEFAVPKTQYDEKVLEKALFLAFIVMGTSYLKAFPTQRVIFKQHDIDTWQAAFLNKVYTEGLSQFAFENNLTRDDLPLFGATANSTSNALPYAGRGLLVLQSGGKDSLLVASRLQTEGRSFTPWYLSSSTHHPDVLDTFDEPLVTALRHIDLQGLAAAKEHGAKNGHVPVTYIVQSLALIQSILLAKNEVLVSIAHEGEEPHAMIGDLPVTHQWSKTWAAEQLFAEYVAMYISPDIHIGSPLRELSELRVAEDFVRYAWEMYGHSFSSCNRANYRQGADNSHLSWCGDCPKCANSFILFAPFVSAADLKELFAGQDLFTKPSLQETFKGLLGVDNVMKPFECVGEINELRYAYHQAQQNGGYGSLSFDVPVSTFDYTALYPAQEWARFTQS